MFASVTGVPDSAKNRPSIHTVAFVSKQDTGTPLYMAKAVRHGKLKIPISQDLPLRDARQRQNCSRKRCRGQSSIARVSNGESPEIEISPMLLKIQPGGALLGQRQGAFRSGDLGGAT
jgi:hypothetical protein